MSAESIAPPEGKLNFSNIPAAQFIEDVDAHMAGVDSAEPKIRALDELHQKYKLMERNLVVRRRRLASQIPDISSSLQMIDELRSKGESQEDTESLFLLSDQIYGRARIPPTDKVCLWLGANVMLEYTLDDAQDLLAKNKSMAEKQIKEVAFDLDFLRDQMTITEVTMARLYNWDVKRRTAASKT